MDTDKIVEKIIKWLSDPKGREMFKTIVYVVLPLFLLLAFRRAGRRRPAEESSTAIEPKIRPASYDSSSATETHSGHAACGNHYTPSMTTITIMEHDLHAMSLSGRKSLTRSGVIGSSAFLN
jgi:hypothetical protein